MSHREAGHAGPLGRTVLLAVKVLHAVAGLLVLAEVGLVLLGVEPGLLVPLGALLALEDVHWETPISQQRQHEPRQGDDVPSSTASEIASRTRPSLTWVREGMAREVVVVEKRCVW